MEETQNRSEHWKVLVSHLSDVATQKGLTIQEIANRCGYARSNVSRIFGHKYVPKLDTYLKIAEAIGIIIDVNDIDQHKGA